MSKTRRRGYICKGCGEKILVSGTPIFCPYCGSPSLNRNNETALVHARNMIQQMTDLLPKMDEAWKAYVELYVEFENTRQKVATYVRRGVVPAEDVPVHRRTLLTEELKAYRAKKGEQNE